ncbi:hypothetical protein NKH77_50275 [Streptomyces sp. M19]
MAGVPPVPARRLLRCRRRRLTRRGLSQGSARRRPLTAFRDAREYYAGESRSFAVSPRWREP